jgi:hypothetical protein
MHPKAVYEHTGCATSLQEEDATERNASGLFLLGHIVWAYNGTPRVAKSAEHRQAQWNIDGYETMLFINANLL